MRRLHQVNPNLHVSSRHRGLQRDGAGNYETPPGAEFLVTPYLDQRTIAIQANGSGGHGTAATAGNPGHLYAENGELVSRIMQGDARTANGTRSEWVQSPSVLSYGRRYIVGVGFKLVNWVLVPSDSMLVQQIHDTPDPGEVPKSPLEAIYIFGGRVEVQARGDAAAKTIANPKSVAVYTGPAVYDAWDYYVLDLTMHHSNGRMTVYRNGLLVGFFAGTVGFNDARGPYAKLGIYQWDAFSAGVTSREVRYQTHLVADYATFAAGFGSDAVVAMFDLIAAPQKAHR